MVATAAAILAFIQARPRQREPAKFQDDLFMRPNEDGLFPCFTQTWRAVG
jgi:hypothetical protein